MSERPTADELLHNIQHYHKYGVGKDNPDHVIPSVLYDWCVELNTRCKAGDLPTEWVGTFGDYCAAVAERDRGRTRVANLEANLDDAGELCLAHESTITYLRHKIFDANRLVEVKHEMWQREFDAHSQTQIREASSAPPSTDNLVAAQEIMARGNGAALVVAALLDQRDELRAYLKTAVDRTDEDGETIKELEVEIAGREGE